MVGVYFLALFLDPAGLPRFLGVPAALAFAAFLAFVLAPASFLGAGFLAAAAAGLPLFLGAAAGALDLGNLKDPRAPAPFTDTTSPLSTHFFRAPLTRTPVLDSVPTVKLATMYLRMAWREVPLRSLGSLVRASSIMTGYAG